MRKTATRIRKLALAHPERILPTAPSSTKAHLRITNYGEVLHLVEDAPLAANGMLTAVEAEASLEITYTISAVAETNPKEPAPLQAKAFIFTRAKVEQKESHSDMVVKNGTVVGE